MRWPSRPWLALRYLAQSLVLALAAGGAAAAEDVYQPPEVFIEEAFAGSPPDPQVLWIDDTVRQALAEVLPNTPRMLRVRYWRRDQRTAWILERIGKHDPITTGVIVDAGKVAKIKVLIYREPRGWEVRQKFFTDQFTGARLTGSRDQLDRRIDGISGATLSVRALTNIAETALVLHDAVVQDAS